MPNQPSASRFMRWFDPRFRQPGTWAFILNRITALGLTLYLAMHLVMLGKLAQGPEAYDSFIALAKTPVIKFGELLVIAAGFIHGINGIRIALTSFGIGVRYQKQLFWIGLALSVVATAIFGYYMFFIA
ncbi:MAG: succinate dehydrogenase, cytochrome b556 subunit [Anaerolineae bacterium]|nr:succinate dehydrogenase, cytochrome b556 subunit [Anaerolineae bacterium]